MPGIKRVYELGSLIKHVPFNEISPSYMCRCLCRPGKLQPGDEQCADAFVVLKDHESRQVLAVQKSRSKENQTTFELRGTSQATLCPKSKILNLSLFDNAKANQMV